MTAKERKLYQQLLEVTRTAEGLAARLVDSNASDEDKEYDVSRTWVDRHYDYDYGKQCLRRLAPTSRAVERKLKQ